MINVPLLRKTMEHIEANPQDWYQSTYRCGTQCCFAGWAALLAGATWLNPDNPYDDSMRTPAGLGTDADEFAVEVLGLSDDQASNLFDGGNSMHELRSQVAELIREAEREAPSA